MAKYHFFRRCDGSEPECTSLSNAKKLLKQYPEGCAWTEHWVRGTFEGTTAIELTGRNDSTIPQHADNKIFVALAEKSNPEKRFVRERNKIAAQITEENEDLYVQGLREYYRQSFRNGCSNESFLLWLEGKLGMAED